MLTLPYVIPNNFICTKLPKSIATICHYRPQTKLRKDNVFISVCQEFCSQGGEVYPSMYWVGGVCPGGCLSRGCVCLGGCLPSGVSAWGCVCPGGCVSVQGCVCLPRGCTPPRPEADTPMTVTAANGTHPTGMHSC